MFDKLAPTPITNTKHRTLLVVAIVWFFVGAWIDSSAHTYLLDDIETFFTPWHAVLYSGYAFSVLVALYVKNAIKDYKFDVGVLGAVISQKSQNGKHLVDNVESFIFKNGKLEKTMSKSSRSRDH